MHEYTDSVSLCKKATGVFTIRILSYYNRKKNFAKGLYKPSELVYNHAIDARHVFFIQLVSHFHRFQWRTPLSIQLFQ